MSDEAQAANTTPVPGARKFHVSLNVTDLDRSVAFYQTLTGLSPAKCHPDYAKFELADPPLVLSLEPRRARAGGTLNHLGIRMPGSAALVEVQRWLEQKGFKTKRQDGVECCYALQTKFWVTDPDGTLWEIYSLQEDLQHRGSGRVPVEMQLADANVEPASARGFAQVAGNFLRRPAGRAGCVKQPPTPGAAPTPR